MAEPIRLYLKDIKDIPLLTPEEELRLAKQVKRSYEKLRRMIKLNPASEELQAIIKDMSLLTQEEELRLAKHLKSILAKKRKVIKKKISFDQANVVVDEYVKARKMMIQSNLRLVVSIAKRYSSLGVSMTDLIEEGNLGLMKAVSRYDPKRGYRFSTYAAWWIRQHITRAIANQGKTIRVPVYLTEMITKWRRTTEQLTHKHGRSPTVKEIAKKMRLSLKKAANINDIVTRTTSLHAPIGDDDSGEFMDLIEDESVVSPVDQLTNLLRHEKIAELLEQMSEREKEIIMLRYGLHEDTTHTLEEVAKKYKLSRERVRQIESNALNKLKLLLTAAEEGTKEENKPEEQK